MVMVVVVMNQEEVLSDDVVEELLVDQYSSRFGPYYFDSVCSKFQYRLVIFDRA